MPALPVPRPSLRWWNVTKFSEPRTKMSLSSRKSWKTASAAIFSSSARAFCDAAVARRLARLVAKTTASSRCLCSQYLRSRALVRTYLRTQEAVGGRDSMDGGQAFCERRLESEPRAAGNGGKEWPARANGGRRVHGASRRHHQPEAYPSEPRSTFQPLSHSHSILIFVFRAFTFQCLDRLPNNFLRIQMALGNRSSRESQRAPRPLLQRRAPAARDGS